MDLFTQRNTAFYYHVDSFQGKPVDAYINFIIPFVSFKAQTNYAKCYAPSRFDLYLQ